MNFSFLRKFNSENLDKVLKKFDKGMNEFSKAVKDFGDSMDKVTKEFSMDIEESNKRKKDYERKNKENLNKLWSNSNVKIWSDKK